MKIMVRALLVSGLVLATLWLVGCGHYSCGATFGNSNCSASGGGLNQGNGGNPTGDAYIYIADPGGIQGLTINVSKGTIVDNCTPSTCPAGIPGSALSEAAVIAQTKFLYVEYPSIGDIFGWTIAADGTLASISGVSPFPVGYLVGGTVGGTQTMMTNPSGTLLFVLDPVDVEVRVYQIGSSGSLTEAAGSPVALPSGFAPFNMAIDGQGKYLYVSNIVGGASTTEIAAYNISTLTAVTGSPFLSSANSQFGLMQMQGDASGKYLIGTKDAIQNADTNLYVLSIAANGSITPVGSVPTVNPPDLVTVQPNAGGTLVYSITIAGLAVGGPVEGFTLNLSTGALTSNGAPTAAASDWAQFDQSGTFLFARDLFSKDLSVYKVSGDSALTTPVASVGWVDGAWAPTDIP
ncbi:MAG TPA: hypothetical protein VE377_07220 [Candidatus Dormibacteraeota bacterium]|nr:hypothetical protein [Candidatus Dormibacteraeota bacterium]